MNPAISIIIPSFNEEKHISRCLDSVLKQTFTDFEVLCVDDGSSDNTFNIIKEYSSKDSRIIPLKNPGKGVSAARNFGLDNAKGDYIGFVDSDDFIQPQMYEFLYKAVTENNCDFSVCGYKKTSEIKEEYFDYKCEEIDYKKIIKTDDLFSSVCFRLFKKFFIKNLKFENFSIGEDTIYNSKLFSNNALIINLPLYNYLINLQSKTSTNFWHEKWFDLVKTRFIAYDILKLKNIVLANYFLECGMKCLLSYRFNTKNTPNEKEFKKPLKDYFKRYIIPFLKCKNISVKNKIIIPIFFFIPPFYSQFRKIMEKIS